MRLADVSESFLLYPLVKCRQEYSYGAHGLVRFLNYHTPTPNPRAPRPPRGGAEAGVGIGMGWVGRIPPIELKQYKISISCFLEEIDPMFKMFENLLNQSQGVFGTGLSQQNNF